MLHFLVHGNKDNVAVAVVEVSTGSTCTVLNMKTDTRYELEAKMDIPLGHKIALADIAEGDTIIKYDQDIGKVVAAISQGHHVHVHNVKTKRW